MTGDVLKTLRKARNLTQAELAFALGVRRETIVMCENTHKPLSRNIKWRLRAYLQLNPDLT